MGSIDENRYRYSIDTLAKVSVSILRYLSENPHHELHIHKLVTYFDVFQLADVEFFWIFCFFDICPVSTPSPVISFYISSFFGIFCHYSIDNTKWYSTIPKGIDTVSIVSILFRTTTKVLKIFENFRRTS